MNKNFSFQMCQAGRDFMHKNLQLREIHTSLLPFFFLSTIIHYSVSATLKHEQNLLKVKVVKFRMLKQLRGRK